MAKTGSWETTITMSSTTQKELNGNGVSQKKAVATLCHDGLP